MVGTAHLETCMLAHTEDLTDKGLFACYEP
jgi:hypothetical protein